MWGLFCSPTCSTAAAAPALVYALKRGPVDAKRELSGLGGDMKSTYSFLLRAWLASALVVLMASCGGEAEEPVPDVVGMKLDAARDDVEDAGFTVEVLGGGTFGAVNESAWVVCEQEPAGGAAGAAEVELTVDRNCGTGSDVAGGSGNSGGSQGSVGAGSAKPTAKARFRARMVQWEALDQARLKVMFTVENRGNASGRPECFVEVDATDINDECFGECGAQDILTGRRLSPGDSRRSFGVINLEGGAAPAVYDVSVLC